MERKKLPPEKVDQLAEQLQGSLVKRRPRSWLAVLVVLALSVLLLGALAWLLYPQPQPPRLEVVAFDALVGAEPAPRVHAQLALPEGSGEFPLSVLSEKDVFFQQAGIGKNQKARSDETGHASASWDSPPLGGSEMFQVRTIDVERRQASNDAAAVFAVAKDARLLLVDVEETLALVDPQNWAEVHPAQIKSTPGAGAVLRQAKDKGFQVVYLGHQPAKAMGYRRIRGWVQGQLAGTESLPSGPVLGRVSFAGDKTSDDARRELLGDVKARFRGELVAIVGTRASARVTSEVGIKTILLGTEDAGAGIARSPSWAELSKQLP